MTQNLRNWLFFIGVFALTPLMYYPEAHDQTLAPRFLGQTLLMLGLFAFEMYRCRKTGQTIVWGWADALFLVWYAWNLASVGWAFNQAELWFSVQKIFLAYTVFWFARHCMVSLWAPPQAIETPLPPAPEKGKKSPIAAKTTAPAPADPWMPLLVANALAGLIVTGYFWGDLFRQSHNDLLGFLNDPCNPGGNLYKLIGLSGHRNLNAGLIFMLMPLSFAALFRWKGVARLGLIVLLALQLAAIFVLQSDAVYLSLLLSAGLGVLGWLAIEGFAYGKRLYRLGFFGVAGGGALLGLGLFFSPFGQNLANRLKESDTGRERLLLWYRTDQLIQEHPLTGVGAGNWQFLMPSKSLVGSYRLQEQNIFATRPHNDFIWILSETGYVGLGLWLALLGYVAFLGVNTIRSAGDRFTRITLAFVLAGLLGYVLFSVFDFPKERIEHQAILSVWLALLASAGYARGQRVLRTQSLLMGLLVLGLLPNVLIGIFRTKGEIAMRQINEIKYALNALPTATDPMQLQAMANQYDIKFNGGAPIAEQRNALTKGLWNTYLQKAQTAGSPWFTHDATTFPVAWHIAVPQYYLGDTTQAFTYFEQSYYQHPFHVDIANNYGSLLLNAQRFDEAIALYQRALIINPDFLDGILNLSKAF